MLKNRKLLFCLGFTTCILPASSGLFLSCSQQSIPSIDKAIIFADNLTATATIDINNEAYFLLTGFSFSGDVQLNRLRLFNSFNIAQGIIQVNIVDWNASSKTFSIKIYTKDVNPGQYFGNLIFKYDGLDIPTAKEGDICLTILDYKQIFEPDNFTDEKQLDRSGNVEFVFSHFTFHGLDDINKISVSSEYELRDATFSTWIEITQSDAFDVHVSVANGVPRLLSSKFSFYYDGDLLTNTPQQEFSIHLLETTQIVEPKNKEKKVIADIYGISTITFTGFGYSGLDPNQLNVSTTFAQSIASTSFSCKIINIDPIAKLFDVQMAITGANHTDNVNGSFTFTWYQHAWTTSDDFSVSIETSVSAQWLDISMDDEQLLSLKGFTSDDLPWEQFDTLLIPDFVQSIYHNAFAGKTIKRVDFQENGALEKINDSAFYQCSLDESITIPATVEYIGTSAFQGDSGLKSVAFKDGNRPLVIGQGAFSGLVNFSGRLSLPRRIESIGADAFNGTTIEELYIPSTLKEIKHGSFGHTSNLQYIYVNDVADQLPSWMLNYSETDGVFDGAGLLLEGHEKIVYIPQSEEIDIEQAKDIFFNKLKLPSTGMTPPWEIVKE